MRENMFGECKPVSLDFELRWRHVKKYRRSLPQSVSATCDIPCGHSARIQEGKKCD